MNWVALLIFVAMPAASLIVFLSAIKDIRSGKSQLYGRPMSSQNDQPFGFAFDVGLKLIVSAMFAAAPVFSALEFVKA